MSKFIIEFDEEKEFCPLCNQTTDCSLEITRICDGSYRRRPEDCPLMKVKEVNHHCDDRPDCVGMKFPKVYEEVDDE